MVNRSMGLFVWSNIKYNFDISTSCGNDTSLKLISIFFSFTILAKIVFFFSKFYNHYTTLKSVLFSCVRLVTCCCWCVDGAGFHSLTSSRMEL